MRRPLSYCWGSRDGYGAPSTRGHRGGDDLYDSDRDHALRAVHMALAMQRRMEEMRQQWFEGGIQTPFRIRIGINTGVASVGDFGSEGRTTYSAIGNQTNLTARIQDRCEPGRVLISHTTWALVHDEIPCKARGEIEVKGLHYPIKVYEVTDTIAAAAVEALGAE